MANSVYQPHQLSDGRWVISFGGNMSKAAARAEAARLNSLAQTVAPAYEEYENPIFGIGALGKGDGAESALPEPRYIPHQGKPGSWVCPAGSTQGQAGAPGDRCTTCGRPADWNPGAGQLLCPRHWDEY